jgi:hypothetical protein
MTDADPLSTNSSGTPSPATEADCAAETSPNRAEEGTSQGATALRKTSLRAPREWKSSIVLALIGLGLISGCAYALIGVFAEQAVKSKSLIVTNSPACRPPTDVALIFQVGDGGKLTASVFPFYPDDGSQDPRCVRIASNEPFSVPANPSEVWGDADRSKPPVVEQLHPDPTTEMWVTEAYYPVPPKPENGMRTIPHNKALTVSFRDGLSRPAYTRAAMQMMVTFIPLLGPKGLSIVLDEHVDLKSFYSKTNEYKVRGRDINVSVSRGLSTFELVVTDLRWERRKEIILLIAGGLLVLGFGCLVDLIVKLLELRNYESPAGY